MPLKHRCISKLRCTCRWPHVPQQPIDKSFYRCRCLTTIFHQPSNPSKWDKFTDVTLSLRHMTSTTQINVYAKRWKMMIDRRRSFCAESVEMADMAHTSRIMPHKGSHFKTPCHFCDCETANEKYETLMVWKLVVIPGPGFPNKPIAMDNHPMSSENRIARLDSQVICLLGINALFYSKWKVDGTVPTYWFIRTLY